MIIPGRKSNRKLRKIGAHVYGLQLLDLSNTAIESLPDFVLSLDNLTALTLRGCRNLKLVPSLAKLISLNELDLGETGITVVPHGLEMLVNLTALILRGCRNLKLVPSLAKLITLNELDLGETGITEVPHGLEMLVNLTTLILRGCRNLKLVPSLAKLITLNELDLGETGITEVPDDLGMLVDLRYLSLNAPELKSMPQGILPELSSLQYLTVFWHSKSVILEEEEIASLKKLETFGGHFKDMVEFSTYIRSLEKRPLTCYKIRVGMSGDGNYRMGKISGKSVILGDCEENSFVLPKDVQYLEIKRCHNITSLCNVPSLNYTSEIKHIGLFRCEGMKHILSFASSSSSCTHSLQTLEILELYNLDNLLELFKAGSSRVPCDTFSCLKRILICNCSQIKKLLPPGLLLHLHNLEEIWVSFCEKLEEIAEEDEEERYTIQITLPRLRILHLSGLPELKTICSKEIVCHSVEKIEIYGCPKLRRLPLSLPVLNGQLFPPPSLKKIETSEEWWESLEWDHRNTKNILQPLLRKL